VSRNRMEAAEFRHGWGQEMGGGGWGGGGGGKNPKGVRKSGCRPPKGEMGYVKVDLDIGSGD